LDYRVIELTLLMYQEQSADGVVRADIIEKIGIVRMTVG